MQTMSSAVWEPCVGPDSIRGSTTGVLRNPVISWEDAYGSPPPPKVRWVEEVEA